ncbi:peptidyl-Lys metalloendopeptidase [Ceratobasidium sp. AG-Ba]|nr:peptidyl-Lys metalloendopeptidase [Ceratobasidium sp. AG-Ba]
MRQAVLRRRDPAFDLLNDPRTVLSKAKTNTFSILSKSGSPKFTGIKAKYVPSKAAALGKDATFTVLAPGQSFKIVHELAGVYNFTSTGEGAYTFGAGNVFNYIDESGALKTIQASSNKQVHRSGPGQSFKIVHELAGVYNFTSTGEVWSGQRVQLIDESGALKTIQASSNKHKFKIAGELAARNSYTPNLSKRAVSFTGCNPTQQSQIAEAATASDNYAEANAYLASISSGTARYTTWFGSFRASRYDTVVSHFNRIGTDATATNYDCTACRTEPGINFATTFAYVDPSLPGKINLCGQFWSAPITGTDSRAGTIVHENSHFTVNGGTDDHAYGQNDSQALAKSNPAQAVDNADNHEYFVENNPALSNLD